MTGHDDSTINICHGYIIIIISSDDEGLFFVYFVLVPGWV